MVLATLGVSACAELKSLQRDLLARAPAEVTVTSDSAAPASLNPADMAYFGRAPRDVKTAMAVPPVPRRKPQRAVPVPVLDTDPELLVGLDFESTKALLGDPALQIEQPPAKVWAYNGGSCMFNVFFYPSMDDNTFRVLTYDVTDGEAKAATQSPSSADASTVKIRDRDSPILRRCFTDLLYSRAISDAG